MNIPQGYKQTELGIIPEDWAVRQLGDCVNVYDGTHQTPNYVPVGIPFYSVENVTANNFSHTKHISPNEHKILTSRYKIQKGDILMTRIGSIGVCKYVDWDVDASFYVSLALLKPYNIDALYMSMASNATYFKDSILLNSLQFAIPQKINLGNISNVKILVPPIAEQRAIAEALSDVDGLIAALDKKIAKKQLLKQGAMQQLLTGKKRLPGFTDEWVEKKLGKMSHIKTGSRNGDQAVENGKYPFFVRSQKVYAIDTYSFDGEAILVPGEGGIGNIFHYINGKFDFHQRVYKISDFADEVCGKFIYFYMSRYFGEYALSLTVKATVDSLRLPTFEEFVICMPSDIKEQQAIATILSDMDKEIADLEAQRDKYRLLKSGMMQKLLTGQIRLKTK